MEWSFLLISFKITYLLRYISYRAVKSKNWTENARRQVCNRTHPHYYFIVPIYVTNKM